MTRALVEDSIGRPFGGQSTSHYSSDRRENRNTCFLTVVSGRVVGNSYLIRFRKSTLSFVRIGGKR